MRLPSGLQATACTSALWAVRTASGLTSSYPRRTVLATKPAETSWLSSGLQATEAVKLILGLGDTLVGRLLLIDVLAMSFRTIAVRKDPECPACGTREITELIDYEEFCSAGATKDRVTGGVSEIQPAQLADRIARGEQLEIIDVREPYEWQIGHIPGARLVPLSTIADEIPRLDKKRTIILYCKVGARSLFAAQQLAKAGASDVRNLAGGIVRWIDEVDPAMTRY